MILGGRWKRCHVGNLLAACSSFLIFALHLYACAAHYAPRREGASQAWQVALDILIAVSYLSFMGE